MSFWWRGSLFTPAHEVGHAPSYLGPHQVHKVEDAWDAGRRFYFSMPNHRGDENLMKSEKQRFGWTSLSEYTKLVSVLTK